MIVQQLLNIIDTHEVTHIVISPINNPVLGVRPSSGRWVSVDIHDTNSIYEIANLDIISLGVMNNMLHITV